MELRDLPEDLQQKFYSEKLARDKANQLPYSSGSPWMDAISGGFIALLISIPFVSFSGGEVGGPGMSWAALLAGAVCFFISKSRIKEHREKREIEEDQAKQEFIQKVSRDL